MTVGLMCSNGQGGVEQQYALFCPTCQIPTQRNGCSKVVLYLLEDVLQRRRKHHPVVHRETQAVGLSWFMIRILSDNHHLHLVERTEIEGIEDQSARWVTGGGIVLLSYPLGQLREIRLLKLLLQMPLPRFLYLYIHVTLSGYRGCRGKALS